jgi:hypothetical protein
VKHWPHHKEVSTCRTKLLYSKVRELQIPKDNALLTGISLTFQVAIDPVLRGYLKEVPVSVRPATLTGSNTDSQKFGFKRDVAQALKNIKENGITPEEHNNRVKEVWEKKYKGMGTDQAPFADRPYETFWEHGTEKKGIKVCVEDYEFITVGFYAATFSCGEGVVCDARSHENEVESGVCDWAELE